MIRTFRSRALEILWTTGVSAKIDRRLHARILRRLDQLNAAARPADMNIPGFDFHALRGVPVRYSVHVNGPWCVTFSWDVADAIAADFEQYH